MGADTSTLILAASQGVSTTTIQLQSSPSDNPTMPESNITRKWEDAFVIVPGPQYGPYPFSSFQLFGFALLGIFPGLSLLVCGLRAYSRRLAGGFAMDDWFVFLAMFLAIPQAVFSAFFVKSGYWGIHDNDIPKGLPPNLGAFWNFANGLCSNPTLGIVKASALLFLLRLGGIKTRVRVACLTLIAINLAHMATFFTVFLFQCWPIQSRWMDGEKAKCIRTDMLSITMAIVSIVTDILTLSIPFVLFVNLRVSRKTRNALIAVFLLGGIVTIISCVRLYFIIRLYYTKPDDRHYSLGFALGCIELNLAIITASIPALWPLARRWFPGLFASLGIDKPHQYADIDVEYVTDTSSSGKRSKIYRSKIVWSDKRREPSHFNSKSGASGPDGWDTLPELPDLHLFGQTEQGERLAHVKTPGQNPVSAQRRGNIPF